MIVIYNNDSYIKGTATQKNGLLTTFLHQHMQRIFTNLKVKERG